MMKKISQLIEERFGIKTEVGAEMCNEGTVADILSRRTQRKYEDKPIDDELLEVLLACAQSAPSKSDLQQYSIIVVKDPDAREVIGGWEGKAPVFLVFCADMRRNQRISGWRGHGYENNNIDSFINATIDSALSMQSLILAAESIGLGCCPISAIRDRMITMCELLDLPPGVYPICGLCIGWPLSEGYVSLRLPPSTIIHQDRYKDTDLAAEIEDYDKRRHERHAIPPEKQRHTDKYGVLECCSWSENVARQLSLPERSEFKDFLNNHGFDLA